MELGGGSADAGVSIELRQYFTLHHHSKDRLIFSSVTDGFTEETYKNKNETTIRKSSASTVNEYKNHQ